MTIHKTTTYICDACNLNVVAAEGCGPGVRWKELSIMDFPRHAVDAAQGSSGMTFHNPVKPEVWHLCRDCYRKFMEFLSTKGE